MIGRKQYCKVKENNLQEAEAMSTNSKSLELTNCCTLFTDNITISFDDASSYFFNITLL